MKRSWSLLAPFGIGLLFTCFGGALLPSLRLWTFAPVLARLHAKRPLIQILWISALSGFVLDILSSQFRMGLFTLIHVGASMLVCRQMGNPFKQTPLSLALKTTAVGATLSLLLFALTFGSRKIEGSLPLLLSDLIFMPALDGLYSLVAFSLPEALYKRIRSYGLKGLFSFRRVAL